MDSQPYFGKMILKFYKYDNMTKQEIRNNMMGYENITSFRYKFIFQPD